MRSSNNGAEAQSEVHPQRWALPKWLEWACSALVLIDVVFIFIPGIFNSIGIGIQRGPASAAQHLLNTVFIASNLLVSLCVVAVLAAALLFNRTALHHWRDFTLFMLMAAYLVGCAYDGLAHLVPNTALPLLAEVAMRLAPGPMALLNDMQPMFGAAAFILVIVIMVRASVHSKR
jgi:hypothetical protein